MRSKTDGKANPVSHLASCDGEGRLPAMYDGPRKRIYFITDPNAGIREKTKEKVLDRCPARDRRENTYATIVYHDLSGMYT